MPRIALAFNVNDTQQTLYNSSQLLIRPRAPQAYLVPGTFVLLNFRFFGEEVNSLDGKGLVISALSDIANDMQRHQPNDEVDNGYWAVDEPPLELEISSAIPTFGRQPMAPFHYEYLRDAVIGLSQFYPWPRPQARHEYYFTTSFDIGTLQPGQGYMRVGMGRLMRIAKEPSIHGDTL